MINVRFVRIIAGEFRGRKLLGPLSDTTRPITDRAKQSLFDVLSPLIADSVVFDLFAGTGSMGLESLSRGATHAVFFEKDRSALDRLRSNIESLKVEKRATVVAGDVFRLFKIGQTWPMAFERADLVFFDPPYRFLTEKSADLRPLIAKIGANHLKPGATIVFRHDEPDQLELVSLERYDQRKYGGMVIELLRVAASK